MPIGKLSATPAVGSLAFAYLGAFPLLVALEILLET